MFTSAAWHLLAFYHLFSNSHLFPLHGGIAREKLDIKNLLDYSEPRGVERSFRVKPRTVFSVT